jgi:beta-glucosidase
VDTWGVIEGDKLRGTFQRKGSHAPLYYARSLTHSPEGTGMYCSHCWRSPMTTLYPFRFGLSYTTFLITNLMVAAPQVKVGSSKAVTVNARNSREVGGDEVV